MIACGAAALIMGSMASCNGGSSKGANGFEDSLSTAIGQMSGAQLNQMYQQIPEDQRSKYPKDAILKGIEIALNTDTAYVQGLGIGMQLAGQLYQYEAAGIKVDRKAVIAAYKQMFMADSIANLDEVMANGQKLMGRVTQIMMEKQQAEMKAEAERKANSPEAKKGTEEGKAYIEKQMKADPSIKRTASGLAYKVVSEGNGATAQANSKVTVKYSGKHIDGKEFDANDNATFPVQGVIPGFAEGLQMMKPGSHYILYIPGDLAYGVDGAPQGGIGPNETLVFDVEVISVDTPAAN